MSPGYPYFYRRWKYGYGKLDLARKQAFGQGHIWLGELDLASFYDIIDHDLLKAKLDSFHVEQTVLERLFLCLSAWTVHPGGYKHSHGIPQGPLPSSFMAECVLHSLDTKMKSLNNSVYFRYVDDITIMSTSEKDARKQFARIEIFCRELGLVPQVKRPIQRLDNVEDLMFYEPSPLQSSSSVPPTLTKKQNDAARKLFLGCFRDGKLNVKDQHLVTKLNYSLFRMNPDKRILNKVIGLLEARPCCVDAISRYLRSFGNNSLICSRLFDYLESEPIYDFVSARCLETIYLCCAKGQYTKLRKICTKSLSQKHHVILRSTAVGILGLRGIEVRELQKLVNKTNDAYLTEYLLSALCNALSDTTTKQELLNKFVRAEEHDIALVSAFLLTANNLKLSGNIADINSWATPILVSKGLTKKRVVGDKIGEILRKRYGVTSPSSFSFRHVLNRNQYKQALLHLITAEGGFATNRSFWVTQMDNFNQILLFVTFRKIGISVTLDKVFGSLSSTTLRNRFPNVAAVFKKCHDFSRITPVPHAYARALGTFARDLKPKERDELCKELKIGYQEFVNKI